ncbi:branched-chain amino acid ABC transporter permease [Nocardia sp. alder85J]|uniref:branched-chain amino acid ABC transporter permease n=1 Tax=Nocardia sp. alder85J TaxID=2862949 RepID=UPI001CD34EF9|nr:branched-chain amino acid ABC transporter permease [Nocardia sp. alder85J]MCX4095055.1 branched-chain amino acid ABC transporter permease [Nocardia sp. alder85J]
MTTTTWADSVHLVGASIGFDYQAVFDNFWRLTVDGVAYGSIYALVAVGYTLVYGVLRLINFAHSEVFMLGMFGQLVGLMIFGFAAAPDAYSQGVVLTCVYLLLAMIVGMLVSGGVAVGLERVAYRPLRKRGARPLSFLITAIGMSFVLQEFVHFMLPKLVPSLGGPNAQQPIILMQPTKQFGFFGADITNITILIVVAAVALALSTEMVINRTRFGRAIRAVAQDPDTATLMGVSRERVIVLTFFIGGVLAGAAALLYTVKIPNGIIYSGGFILGIKAFSAAVLGGIGNLRGALLGGLILGVVEQYGQILFGTQWRDVVAFLVLVLVLMVRPTGILGESLGRARA